MFRNSLTRLAEQVRRIARGGRSATAHRGLSFELLEPRLTLAAAGLVPVGSQPAGSLAGKIVYLSPGHGLQFDSSNQWYLGRSETQEMVEPFGTQDQATYLADYLFRAGATVVPMRPIGHQLNEVVLDNDSAGVTFAGSWSNSSGTRFYDEDYGATTDAVSYRFANISATETATATYTPNIASAGFYPVYAWAAHGGNRTSQLYEINHSGGQTQVRIDHRMVGNGWVYLGTYHFDTGSDAANGSVVISNQSTAGGNVVIADAIRFGNGMGDVPDGPNGAGNSGGTLSGRPREDEASLLWIIRSIGQGVNTSTFFGVTGSDPNVSGPARLAEEMNNNSNPFGSSLYLAIHSNAFDGTARGAIGLITSQGSPTPNQTALATWLGQYVNEDLRAVDQDLGFTWSNRATYTLTGSYGEFNADDFTNSNSAVEMDASLAEVGFHDNVDDALIMRDPKGRDAIGRALYHVAVQYFDVYGGLATPIMQPSRPINISAVSNGSGAVTLSWAAGPTSTAYGPAATDYRIYASSDGYGFDGGRLASSIAGGTATSKTINGLDPTLPYYFKIVAVNAGGESPGSEVVTALPTGSEKQVLIVNGFDRNHVSQDFRYTTTETIPGSNITVDRVYPRFNNSFDYVVQVASAIQASKPGLNFASASNELVISGAVNLNDYDAVIWISGTESTIDRTFNATEQTLVTNFINAGGSVFLSGSDIGLDLDQQNNGRTFYETALKANYVSDDAGTYTATAAAGGIFAGIGSLGFSNGATFSNLDDQLYDVSTPDVLAPQAGATSALTYSGGIGGTAAIQVVGTGGLGSIVLFGFPFETITSTANRAAVMDRVLDLFFPNGDFNGNGLVDGADFVVWRKNNGQSVPRMTLGDANGDGLVNQTDYAIWHSQFGTVPLTLGAIATEGVATASVSLSQATASEQSRARAGEAGQHGVTPAARNLAFDALVPAVATTARRRLTAASLVNAQQNRDWPALLNVIAEHKSIRAAGAERHESSHDADDSPSESGDSRGCTIGAGLRQASKRVPV